MIKVYIVVSYFMDGSSRPSLDFFTDEEHKIGDLISAACTAVRNGMEVDVFEVSTHPKLLYTTCVSKKKIP